MEGNAIELSTPAAGASNAALLTFGVYLALVFFLAWLSGRVRRRRDFVSEYFLGSRNLGLWAFALTFAATSASGGSFMGFPSLIYTHGWVMALWIAGYMAVPLVTTGFLAKRINQVARRAKAVTVPDILRARFGSQGVGLVATAILVFFMFFYLLAQFKAGSSILVTLFGDIPMFEAAVVRVAVWQQNLGWSWLSAAEPDFLLCLSVFAGAVILYTAYGGFRAVVWTDVMQGAVMVLGVGIMLVLLLYHLGGLERSTKRLAAMTPPEHGEVTLEMMTVSERPVALRKGSWLEITDQGRRATMARTKKLTVIPAGMSRAENVEVLLSTTPEEIAFLQPDPLTRPIRVTVTERTPYGWGAGMKGAYLKAPGPDAVSPIGFLSLSMAFSFFLFWPFAGVGQPSNMVRQMAFRDSRTLRHSIVLVCVYFSLIYFPLVIIFCGARLLVPGMEIEPDRVMPETAHVLADIAGTPWLAGLIVAAPFAAVMSSVDSFLLMVSSGLVRDLYQRNINPSAGERTIKRLTYGVTVVVGLAAAVAVLNPPQYLQSLIVFATGGLAGCFLMPMVLTLFWPRTSNAGVIAGMLGGCAVHLTLLMVGYQVHGRFQEYELWGLDPFLWDVAGSGILTIAVSCFTPWIPEALERRFFGESSRSRIEATPGD